MVSIVKHKKLIIISNQTDNCNYGASIELKNITLYSILRLLWWKILENISYEKSERDN